jgi:hypothetical protein
VLVDETAVGVQGQHSGTTGKVVAAGAQPNSIELGEDQSLT